MAEVYGLNIVMNFKYTIYAVSIFMSRIILQKLETHRSQFRNFEKEFKLWWQRYLLHICKTLPKYVSSKFIIILGV